MAQLKNNTTIGGNTFTVGNSFYAVANGNVGVGDSAPNTSLAVNGSISVSTGIRANGSFGSAGQVLTSNGTTVYWSTVTGGGGGSVNVDSQYVWTNTHTFNQTINGTANNALFLGGNSAANLIAYSSAAYANAVSYVDGKSYVNTSQLSSNLAGYQTTAGLAANVATLAANSATYANASISNTFTVGNSVYFVANGNVGIGNSTPNDKLFVDGKANTQSIKLFRTGLGLYDNVIDLSLSGNYWRNDGALSASSFAIELTNQQVLIKNAEVRLLNTGKIGFSNGNPISFAADSYWTRDAAGIIAQKDSVNPQSHRIYGTFTDASNYERLNVSANATAHFIQTQQAGTGTARALYLGANNTTHMVVSANGNVGVGTSSPTEKLSVYDPTLATLLVSGDSGVSIISARYSTDASSAALNFRKYRGSTASPAAVTSSDIVGMTTYAAFDGVATRATSQIIGSVSTFNGSNDLGGRLSFTTRPTGAGNLVTERMAIESNGDVKVGNSTVNVTINSTSFSGTANNATNLNGVAAANYVQNTDSRTLSGNLVFSGANVAFTGNLRVTGGLLANGSLGTANQVLTTNGSSVYWANGGGGGAASSITRQTFNGDGTTTSFTVTGGYTANQIDVYLNGVKQLNGTDVTVTSGTAVVFAIAPPSGSVIEVTAITVSNVVTANEVGGYYKGGATTVGSAGNANNIFRINAQTLHNDTYVNSDENASCTGPITVASGKVLVVAPGGRIVIA